MSKIHVTSWDSYFVIVLVTYHYLLCSAVTWRVTTANRYQVVQITINESPLRRKVFQTNRQQIIKQPEWELRNKIAKLQQSNVSRKGFYHLFSVLRQKWISAPIWLNNKRKVKTKEKNIQRIFWVCYQRKRFCYSPVNLCNISSIWVKFIWFVLMKRSEKKPQ